MPITAVAAWRSVAIGQVDSFPSWSTSVVGARSSGGNRCLVGATGAIARGAFGCWFTWQKERQSVAAAFAGEVLGFMDAINWRGIREFIARGYKFPIDDHPFPVFEANVGKIGLLPADLAGKVAGFYSQARGIVQDFLTINKGEPIQNDSEFRARLVENIDAMKTKANALISQLKIEAPRTWRDYLQPT